MAVAACTMPAGPGPITPLRSEFELLRSRHNGLYFAPQLLDEIGGVEDNSYAIRTLAELGQNPKITAGPQVLAKFRDEALGASVLWGRALLVPLYEAGATEILNHSDALELRKLRTAEGWFADPAVQQPSQEEKVAFTEAALSVLAAVNALDASDRLASLSWLRGAVQRPSTVRASGAAISALTILGDSVSGAPIDTAAPALASFETLSANERIGRVEDAFWYAKAMALTGDRGHLNAGDVARLFRDNVNDVNYQTLYKLVMLARAAQLADDTFKPVIDRLARARMPDGTVRNFDSYSGSAIASLYVMRLMKMGGESTSDPRLVEALKLYAELDEVRSRPVERLIVASALVVAGHTESAVHAKQLCSSPDLVPRTVVAENAEGWRELATICHDLGVAVAAPQVQAWQVTTPEDVFAMATMVIGLADSGHRSDVPSWIDPAVMRAFLLERAADLPLHVAATVARSYVLVGGGSDMRPVELVWRLAATAKGCTGLPSLYRSQGSATPCNLRSTWLLNKLGQDVASVSASPAGVLPTR